MGIRRAVVIRKMRAAFEEGISFNRFEKLMRAEAPSPRRSVMQADWRSENELAKKEDLIKYVRKDRYPTKDVIAAQAYKFAKNMEFMYVVKVQHRLRPGEPITERKVNIMSDVPLTPGMVEAEVAERWQQWEKYGAEEITGLYVWAAVRSTLV